jgi:UDP-N-acetylmuramoyl-tripeptide--D-alanyl-D-alanine ligase
LSGKKYVFNRIKLLGRQNIENLLPGVFIGMYMGIDTILIRKALAGLKPLDGTMRPKLSRNKTLLIDDTYNANINSVKKVLSYMKLFKGKRVLVLEPLLELGKNAQFEHEKIGFEASKVCDYIFLTNTNYLGSLKEGHARAKSSCTIQIASPSKIIKFVNRKLSKDDVVIFEGKEAGHSLYGISSSPAL